MSRTPRLGAKDRIRNAAIDLFSTRGFEAASVREIVSKAGVSKPTLYYYFRDKAALAQELLTVTSKEFREVILKSSQDEPDFTEAVSELIYKHCHYASRHLKFVRFLFATLFGNVGPSRLQNVIAALQQSRKDSEAFVQRAAARHGLSPAAAAHLPEVVMSVIYMEIMGEVVGLRSAITRRRARSLSRFLVSGTQHLAGKEAH